MNFWRSLSVKKKVGMFMGLLFLNICALAYVATTSMDTVTRALAESTVAAELTITLHQREIDHLIWANTVQAFALDAELVELKAQEDPAQCAFGKWYYSEQRKVVEKTFPSLSADLKKIEPHHAALHQSATKIKNARSQRDNTTASKIYREETSIHLKKVQDALDSMGSMLSKERIADALVFAKEIEFSTKALYSMTALGAFMALFFAFVIYKTIVNPIVKIAGFAASVAKGNLNTPLAMNREDEIGQLAHALQAIPDVLQKVILEYEKLEKDVESGNIGTLGDSKAFPGDYALIVNGTNNILTRLNTIIHNIPSPVILLDKHLRATYLNGVAQKLSTSDYMGKTCTELFAREDSETDKCALTKAVATKMPASAETRARISSGTLDISYTAIPMLDANGNLASVMQLITDLTAIKQAQNTIFQVATQARDISSRVATAAEQLSSQVDQVSNGAGIQRDRASSTATAMEEMNSTVMEVARNAAQANEQAKSTSEKAHEGAQLVSQVVAAIENVNKVATELERNIQDLGKQAESIGEVMNVISDIADQTNLLALNAAIEAARAGDAGRGFAVVADEVRKLAENTMKATNEVGSRIHAIQESTASNVTHVASAASGVAKATQLAATSGAALSEILSFANANLSLIAGIATAAEQQSATSEEISGAIDDINRIAGATADGMIESASAVQELSHMAHELQELLDKLQHQST